MPISINAMLTKVLLLISSFSARYDNSGTKTYPRDSNIGISFSFTPLLMAVMLMSKDPKKMAYATMTLQLSIERKKPL